MDGGIVMKRNITYRLCSFHAYEHEAVEAYLQEMAKQGWMITRLYPLLPLMQFEKMEPKTCVFHVLYDPQLCQGSGTYNCERHEAYIDFIEEYGYRYLCDNRRMLVFCSDDDNVMEINEDNEENQNHMRHFVLYTEVLLFNIYLLAVCNGVLTSAHITPWYMQSTFTYLLIGVAAAGLLYSLLFTLPALVYLMRRKTHSTMRSLKRRGLMFCILAVLLEVFVLWMLTGINSLYALVFLALEVVILVMFMFQAKRSATAGVVCAVLSLCMMLVFFVALIDNDTASRNLNPDRIPMRSSDLSDITLNSTQFHMTYEESMFLRWYQIDEFNLDDDSSDCFSYTLYIWKDTPLKKQIENELINMDEMKRMDDVQGYERYAKDDRILLVKDGRMLEFSNQVKLNEHNWNYIERVFSLA